MTSDSIESWADERLRDGLRERDARCVEELLRRFHDPLLRYGGSYLNDAALAEDVVQQVFAKLAEGEGTPDGALKPWLYRVVRNRCLDILRRQKRSPTHNKRLRTGFDAARRTAGPGTRMARDERRALIREIIERMPEDYRGVLMLKYFEGFTRAEIAESLGVSEAAVKGRIVRASEHLESELRKYTWTEP
jgi:RNA polymerase sigma-70 factor (ECF subfamily)